MNSLLLNIGSFMQIPPKYYIQIRGEANIILCGFTNTFYLRSSTLPRVRSEGHVVLAMSAKDGVTIECEPFPRSTTMDGKPQGYAQSLPPPNPFCR